MSDDDETPGHSIELKGGPGDGSIINAPHDPASFNSMAIGYQEGRAIYRRTTKDLAKERWVFEYDEPATRERAKQ